MTFSDLQPRFQGHDFQRQITRKWCNIELCLQWPTNRKSYMIHRTAPFSMTLNDPYPRFQGHAFLTLNILRNGTIYRHFNGMLIGTYTHPIQQCRFEWPCVILSDLAKYSMTSSVARSLCDSWASCCLREGGSHLNIAITFGVEKLELCGYPMIKKIWGYSYSFWHNTRKWQTDACGQTPHDAIGRAYTQHRAAKMPNTASPQKYRS